MAVLNFIADNYVMLFELLGLLIVLRISAHISPRMKRQTCVVVALLFLETVIYTLERWTQTLPRYTVARPLLTAAMYSIYPAVLICLTQLTATWKRTRWQTLLLLAPEILSIPLFFTSQWTHLVSWYLPENAYQGGVLSNWPYIVFGFYILVFVVSNMLYFKSYARADRRVMVYVILGPLVGVLLFLALAMDRDFGALFTSGILLYYICIYIHMAKLDPLTQLLNRQSYYEDIRLHGDAVTAVASVDMNELKHINDTQGHEAGDRAITVVAQTLRENCGRSGTVYRVGGDEFMIFYFGAREQEVVDAIAEMRRALRRTPYACAFGYAMHTPDDALQDVIVTSDERMYADKAEMKRKTLAQGGTLRGRK